MMTASARRSEADTSTSRKRLSAADRRGVILDAAVEAFARRGYHGAAIDEIAQAAGISKALIYEHFPSKKALHASLVERLVDEIFAGLRAVPRGAPEPRLRASVDVFLRWVEINPEAFRLLFRDVFEPDVAEVLSRLQAQATAGIAAMMWPQEDIAVETFAQLISGAVQSLAIWWQDHPGVERKFLVDRVMDLAWTGLERIADQ
jgi:AcrR family transcriptional regulator